MKTSDIIQTYDESQKYYSYNGAVHHLSVLVEEATKDYGLPFEKLINHYLNEIRILETKTYIFGKYLIMHLYCHTKAIKI